MQFSDGENVIHFLVNFLLLSLHFSVRIIRLVPKRLTKWQSIIDANIEEIKTEYIYVSKKAVVDFVLGKSLDSSAADEQDVKVSRERNEIREIGKHHAHS